MDSCDIYESREFEEETVDELCAPLKLWKRSDVLYLLQVSERTLRNLIKTGRLRVVKLGGSERFRPDDLRALIENGVTAQVDDV
jgi:excisionase family DNA binding protein